MIVLNHKSRLSAPSVSGIMDVARHLGLAMLSVCLITLCQPSIGLDWSGGNQSFLLGHIYASYTSDWVPSPQGILVDITGEIVLDDDQGHVNDIHGNTLTINTATNTVYANHQATGFVYVPGP